MSARGQRRQPQTRVWRAEELPVSGGVPKGTSENACIPASVVAQSRASDMSASLRKEVDVMRAALKGAVRASETNIEVLRHLLGQLDGIESRLATLQIE